MLRAAMEAASAAENRIEDLMRGHRRQRDEAAPKVYGYLTRIRRGLRGYFGRRAGDEFLGIHGPTPEDPQELYDLAARLAPTRADGEFGRGLVLDRRVRMDPVRPTDEVIHEVVWSGTAAAPWG